MLAPAHGAVGNVAEAISENLRVGFVGDLILGIEDWRIRRDVLGGGNNLFTDSVAQYFHLPPKDGGATRGVRRIERRVPVQSNFMTELDDAAEIGASHPA